METSPVAPLLPSVAVPELPEPPPGPCKPPLAYVDILVEGFLSAVQGSSQRQNGARQLIFHAIDQVFCPLDTSDPPSRQQPISVKKLRKGDACWATRKTILGWVVDTL